MLLSIALIMLVGMAAAMLSKKVGLPGLVGMILTGAILGPCVLNLIDDSILNISSELRKIALIIILTRAGLTLDLDDLKRAGRPALLMCFLPASFEILGMILVFSMFGKMRRSYRRTDERRRMIAGAAAISITVLIVVGNCYTDYRELRIAKYRKANYRQMAETIVNYEEYEPEELAATMEWHKDPAELISAIEILKDNKLNVFSKPQIADNTTEDQ